MSRKNPYIGLPNYQFWNKENAIISPSLFDPVFKNDIKINVTDKIVTAGSCFAQHVANHLVKRGLNHYIAEKSHSIISKVVAEKFNYNRG